MDFFALVGFLFYFSFSPILAIGYMQLSG